jgi:hypothetical protein
MATAPLSDELATDARILWALFRTSTLCHPLSREDVRADIAAKAGCTPALLTAWVRGEGMPEPHRARTIITAVIDQQQRMAEGAAKARLDRITPPNPIEHTEEGALAALAQLRADFPGYKVEIDGLETLKGDRHKLVWLAWQDDSRWAGATASELRGRLDGHEAWLAEQAKRSGR